MRLGRGKPAAQILSENIMLSAAENETDDFQHHDLYIYATDDIVSDLTHIDYISFGDKEFPIVPDDGTKSDTDPSLSGFLSVAPVRCGVNKWETGLFTRRTPSYPSAVSNITGVHVAISPPSQASQLTCSADLDS
jgi:hypothetical protein